MKLTRIFLVALLCFFLASIASAQEPTATATTTPVADDSLQTQAQDIKSSTYEELQNRCKSLGLPVTGTIDELRVRLFEHFNIPASMRGSAQKSEKGNLIKIVSAGKTEYFTLDEIDQKYIRMTSDVELVIEDKKNGTVHTIKADQILINQTNRLLHAEGNVVYSINEKGNTETFYGDGLDFNVDTWDGVFFQGVNSKEVTIKNSEEYIQIMTGFEGVSASSKVEFYIQGENIQRKKDDTILISNARITSSNMEAPNYAIEAQELWIFKGGEWGFSNAVFYIGHIPVLWIPFYYKPSDKIFFNPVFGQSDLKGSFLQTTTYLEGRPQDKQSGFSFLQIANDETVYKQRLEGFYLVSTGEQEKVSGNVSKIMADYYTNLGFGLGFDFNRKTTGFLKTLDLESYFLITRNVYLTPLGGLYAVPFWAQASDPDSMQSTWNSTFYPFGQLPIRFAVLADLSMEIDALKIQIAADILTDANIKRDFFPRQETVDMLSFMDPLSTEAIASSISSSVISLTGSYSPQFSKGTIPFVDNFSVSSFVSQLNMKSFTPTDESYIWDDHAPVPAGNRTIYFYPEKNFFFPDTFKAIDAKSGFSGNIFSWSSQTTAKTQNQGDKPKEELLPFYKTENETGSAESPGIDELLAPQPSPNSFNPSYSAPSPASVNLSYQVTPSIIQENRFDSNDWKNFLDVDYQFDYSSLYFISAEKLTLDVKFPEPSIDGSLLLTVNNNYKTHYTKPEGVLTTAEQDLWNAFLRDDVGSTYVSVTEAMKIKYNPFIAESAFGKTNIQYQIDSALYSHKASLTSWPSYKYEDLFWSWNKETVSQHRLTADLFTVAFGSDQNIKSEIILPPLNMQVILNGSFKIDSYSLGVRESFAENNTGDWTTAPVAITQKILLFSDQFSVSLDNKIDVEKQEFDSTLLTLQWEDKFFKTGLNFNLDTDSDTASSMLEAAAFLGLDQNKVSLKLGAGYDYKTALPDKLTAEMNLYGLALSHLAAQSTGYSIPTTAGWVKNAGLTNLENIKSDIKYTLAIDDWLSWKDRISLSFQASSALTVDWQRFTETQFTLNLSAKFKIYEFLDVYLQSGHSNDRLYVYFPFLCELLPTNPTPKNVWIDLLNSFNFFDGTDNARRNSLFKVNNYSIGFVHHLEDWDLIFRIDAKLGQALDPYSGLFINTLDPKWSFFIQWKGISEIKSKLELDEEDKLIW